MKRSIVSVPVQRAGSLANGRTASDQDLLAVEEPLQIRLGDRDLAITAFWPLWELRRVRQWKPPCASA